MPWSCSAARSNSIPANTLAKAGLVRVADRLLTAAERALTAGNPEDARKMVDVAEIAHAGHGARRFPR